MIDHPGDIDAQWVVGRFLICQRDERNESSPGTSNFDPPMAT